jgi:hypothetical protein
MAYFSSTLRNRSRKAGEDYSADVPSGYATGGGTYIEGRYAPERTPDPTNPAGHPRGGIRVGPEAGATGYTRPTTQTGSAVSEIRFEGPAPIYGGEPLPEFEPVQMGDLPTLEVGEMPDLPAFAGPEYDERRVTGRTQQLAGLPLREAKRSLREATVRLGTDPASVQARRAALEAHGINVSRIVGGARETAGVEEERRVAREMQPAIIEYQAEVQRMRDVFTTETTAKFKEYAAQLDRIARKYSADLGVQELVYKTKIAERDKRFQASWETWKAKGKQVSTTTASKKAGLGDDTGRPTLLEQRRQAVIKSAGLRG